MLLGRDTFSGGAIRSQTIDATLAALAGFREIMDNYGVRDVRAVATSAAREARNGELFLGRIRGRTGIAFDIINEAEESRLVYEAVRHALHGHAALKGAWTLVAEVGGGSTSAMLLRREALYAASRAGVRIALNVRGICALRFGIPGASETISVVSVIDRFLEHSRIYWFLNGGDDELYLASADWVTRDLDKRIELMFPIETPMHRSKVLHALRLMFRDNVKSRRLDPDGVSRYRTLAPGEPLVRVQALLQDGARRAAHGAREAAGVSFREITGAAEGNG